MCLANALVCRVLRLGARVAVPSQRCQQFDERRHHRAQGFSRLSALHDGPSSGCLLLQTCNDTESPRAVMMRSE